VSFDTSPFCVFVYATWKCMEKILGTSS